MRDLGPGLRALVESADPISSDEARSRARVRTRSARVVRRFAISVAVAVVAVVAIVASTLSMRSSSPDRTTVNSPTGSIDLDAGACAEIAPAPIVGRSGHSAIWTGSEMIVWGGDDGRSSRDDGAAYDPTTDTWRAIAQAPIEARANQAAVWTGSEMLVWGGGNRMETFADGAAYDPTTDTWRRIAAAPRTGATDPVSVWTGREWILTERQPASGGPTREDSSRLLAYDPATDHWRTLPRAPVAGGYIDDGVWTGRDVLFTVLPGFPLPTDPAVRLVRYDPTTDRWSEPDAIIAGSHDDSTGSLPRPELVQLDHTTLVLSSADFTSLAISAEGAVREIASSGPALMGTTLAAGDVVVQWGSGLVNTYLPDGDRWIDAATGNVPAELVQGEQPVWTGRVLLVWGGSVATGGKRPIDGGVAYRPTTGDDARNGCPLRQEQARRAKEPVADEPPAQHSDWKMLSAGDPTVSIRVPPSWTEVRRDPEALPSEVVVVGTDPLERWESGYCGSPGSPHDSSYVVIAEHHGSGPYRNGWFGPGEWDGTVADRPPNLSQSPQLFVRCAVPGEDRSRTVLGWTFRDQGRVLSATVFLGPRATEADRLRATDVVSSLRVEARPPTTPLPAGDDAAVRAAVTGWLTAPDGSAAAPFVDDYARIADALRDAGPVAVNGGFTDFDLSRIDYRIDEVAGVSRGVAEFVYSVLDARGAPIYDRRVGRAVRVGREWKVTRETACAYVARRGSVACSPS